MKTIAEIFGIETISKDLYRYALTHSSYTKELNISAIECYERLEFLGDAVLKLSISDVLYKKYPEAPEGELSKIRSIIVSDNTLADIAKKNGLQQLIILGRHEEKQGCRKLNSICACAFEATLGAYYLDGKYAEVVEYIKRTFEPYIEDVREHFEKFNAKAILQEYTQGLTKNTPVYRLLEATGPEHKKEFKIEVSYNGEVLAVEKGSTKKEAEQRCAYTACKKLGII
ncbi:MAG: ribonuclease III [Muribaculaceae bacterium]|nr:ribonuclease III [Muribaculaceae bacterium]